MTRGLAKGIGLLYLEAGAATLRAVAGWTMATEETRPPVVAEAGPPMEVGAEAFLLPGEGAFVPHEADVDLRAGTDGATLLVLTLHASAVQPLPEVGS